MSFEDPAIQSSPVPSDPWTGSDFADSGQKSATAGLTQGLDLHGHTLMDQASKSSVSDLEPSRRQKLPQS